jgi:hypothetical protein
MQGNELIIGGAPLLAPPPPIPDEPENPDLSGLRNMMEEAVEEGQKRQSKPSAGAALLEGDNAGDLLVWDGAAWIVLAKPAGYAILAASATGIPEWVAPPASEYGTFLSADTDGRVYWDYP